VKTIQAKVFLTIILLLAPRQYAFAQNFVNLNFESANISGFTLYGDVPIDTAMPGWSGHYSTTTATNQTTQVWYDGISLGGYAISLVDSNIGFGFLPVQGRYGVYLFGGGNVSSTISQTGLVPGGTKSLIVDIQASIPSFIVSLGGQAIDMVPLQTFSTYTLYGGDISSFAGQVAILSFIQPPPASNPPSAVLLDNMVFSPTSVPEPGSLSLFSIGALLLGFFHRRNSSR
jgi:PEP-CTERM motif